MAPRIVHVLGDSHSEVFSLIQVKNVIFKRCMVIGATASGITNPNSQTNAKNIFESYLSQHVKKGEKVILMLGEVDCGFLIWLRAQNKEKSVDEQLKETIENYTSFIRYCTETLGLKVIVSSSVLPTIQDGTPMGDVANLRSEVKATLNERTALTLKFNETLRMFCENNKIGFLDLDRDLLDPETGVIRVVYRNNDLQDHHLDPAKFSALVSSVLLSRKLI